MTSVNSPEGTLGYRYDAASNRLTQTVNGVATSYAYDDAGELTSAGSTSYRYDANGNLTAAGSDSYSWDWNNQLTSATVGGVAASYRYDGAGTRVGATVGGTTSTELWDTADGLSQLVSDGTTSYLQSDGLQAAVGANGTSYPLADALGSVRGVTDGSGNLVGTSDYDVFGAVRSQSGTSLGLGFTGQQSDATGLVYLRARALDPSLGRFLSADSVIPNAPGSQGYNLYAYVANNPTTWTDPTGNAVSALAEGILFLGTACLWFTWCRVPLADGTVRLTAGVESGDLPLAAGGFAESVFSLVACALVPACVQLAQRMANVVHKYGSGGPAIPAGANAPPVTTVNTPQPVPVIEIPECRWPEATAHVRWAQANGWPSRVTIDRSGIDARRQAAMAGHPPQAGKDRDEYPPAMFKEGGKDASVRYISPSDNRGLGSYIRARINRYANGTVVELKVVACG